jgi:alpha-galactosidase
MPDVSTLAKFTFADMVAEYLIEQPSQAVGLRLYPAALETQVAAHRTYLNQPGAPAWRLEPLVQFKLVGDPTSGFSQGMTMRNSATLASLHLEDQQALTQGEETTVVTRLASERGYACEQRLSWHSGERALRVNSIFHNRSEQPLTLEMLASFSLGGLTPFASDDAPGRLYLHRFRSAWSAEGRHECRLAEEMGLEPSWSHHGVRVERFGQVGSLPVRGFFPWAGVEDRQAGVMWGAQLAIPASWQMEFYRRDDFLSFSGGLADREFGHWWKTVAPGEQFASPVAYLSCVQGDAETSFPETSFPDDLCARLVEMQLPAAEAAPVSENDLPVICNEWCTSWGNPRHADLVAMAERLQGSGVKYLVIDAGWYKGDAAEHGQSVWHLAQGDWIANSQLFPLGLAATAQALRERGLIPGIWFEMEVCGEQSPRFAGDIPHFLQRDGVPVTASGRRFWDFRQAWVIDYLSQKVIEQLRENGFGYIKVDYNETIGLGCDGAESPGEGLRQHMAGVQRFFRKMRAELPELVIENCASGGHRLEPSMMALSSMASFSDAHETRDIPVIAANLQRLILPRQSQIWAVLHATDTMQRLAYLLTAGFLGRLCISGEITSLTEDQWALVKEAIRFYAQVAPAIARGTSRLFQAIGPSWQHLQGAQAVMRVARDGQLALLVTHSFGAPLPAEIRVPLPGTGWQVAGCFPPSGALPQVEGSELHYRPSKEWEGSAIYLRPA